MSATSAWSTSPIDVHNHYRQGTLALEAHWTTRWDWRFFGTFLGVVEVDACVAYKRFCPGKQDVTSVTAWRARWNWDSSKTCGPPWSLGCQTRRPAPT
jgi:hypothetical protein